MVYRSRYLFLKVIGPPVSSGLVERLDPGIAALEDAEFDARKVDEPAVVVELEKSR